MRELTLDEMEEVAGGIDISFNGALTYIAGGLTTVGLMTIGLAAAPAVLIGGAVVFLIDNWEANIYYTGQYGGLYAPIIKGS